MNPFLGEVRMAGFNFAPPGWALCNGQSLAIATNTALFSLLGINFGGDGTSTFDLPDFRGRMPLHWGQGVGLTNRTIGQAAGRETVTLNISQIPGHNHLVTADGDATDTVATNPSGHWLGATGLNTPGANAIYSRTDSLATPVTMDPQMIGVAGGDGAHSNMSPFLAITFIIALQGIFPSRN